LRKRAEDQLVVEVEAFLAGHVEEVVVDGQVFRAPWAPVNWVAHAPPREILTAACRPRYDDPRWGTWPWAVNTVLHELVSASGGSDVRIVALQRACLIPYELSLMCARTCAATPFDLVAETVSALRNYPVDGSTI
jgi:hypothetical protein